MTTAMPTAAPAAKPAPPAAKPAAPAAKQRRPPRRQCRPPQLIRSTDQPTAPPLPQRPPGNAPDLVDGKLLNPFKR